MIPTRSTTLSLLDLSEDLENSLSLLFFSRSMTNLKLLVREFPGVNVRALLIKQLSYISEGHYVDMTESSTVVSSLLSLTRP